MSTDYIKKGDLGEGTSPSAEDYKALKVIRSPLSIKIAQALIDVKNFIRERQLILTGGTAIDFALRLEGDKIYSDETLSFPDLDMYSPNNVEDAYDLADILYAKGYGDKTPGILASEIITPIEGGYYDNSDIVGGFPSSGGYYDEFDEESIGETSGGAERVLPPSTGVNVIVGVHVQTLRVRLDREVVADISYIPKVIYDSLPYIIYDGMRVIHPHWQMMNVHLAVMYPLSGVPNEAIFKRLKKDLSRFNLLYSHYPVISLPASGDMTMVTLQDHATHPDTCLYGFAAYAALYELYKRVLPNQLTGIGALHIENGKFLSPIPVIDYIMDKIPEDISNTNSGWMQYDPVIDYNMGTYRKETKGITTIIHHLTHGVIPLSRATFDKHQYYIPTAQSVLLYLLLRYHVIDSLPKEYSSQVGGSKALYAYYYTSLLSMVRRIGEYADEKLKGKEQENFVLNSPFLVPQLPVFGTHYYSTADEIMLDNALRDLQVAMKEPLKEKPYIPTNYWTVRQKARPTFDYSKSPYFQIAGLPSLIKESVE